jgi:SAM-dependent methyltransferase
MFASEALEKLIRDYDFQTVLDIGSGAGLHSKAFVDAGKTVSAIDLGQSIYYDRRGINYDRVNIHHINFYEYYPTGYDCVWASHILEHQVNPGIFLEKCFNLTRTIFAITVPPLKHNIVGGHVSLWNAGLLLYNMILAGFDCSQASVKSYGYNISVIVRKQPVAQSDLNALHYDSGDVTRLQKYFPVPVSEGFDGQIPCLNW